MRAATLLGMALLVSGCFGATNTGPTTGNGPEPDSSRLPPASSEPGIAALQDAFVSGAPHSSDWLPVGPAGWQAARSFTISWRPAASFTSATWAMAEDNLTAMPAFGAAEGEVDGVPDAEARVVWTSTWARGTVVFGGDAYYLFIGDAPGQGPPVYYHEPGGTGLPRILVAAGAPIDAEGGDASTRDASTATPRTPPPARLAPTCGGRTDVGVPQTSLGRFQGDTLRLRFVGDADNGMTARYGDDIWAVMAAYALEIDALFAHEIGVRLDIVGLHVHTEPRFQTQEPANLLEDFAWPLGTAQEYWAERPEVLEASDSLHVWSNWRSGAGQASSIGGVGSHDTSQIDFSTAGWYDADAASGFFVAGQEIGHVLGGHHHYDQPTEAYGADVISHGYLPGNHAIISSANRAVIRACTEAVLSPWSAPTA